MCNDEIGLITFSSKKRKKEREKEGRKEGIKERLTNGLSLNIK